MGELSKVKKLKIDPVLLDEAQALGVNVSEAAADGIAKAVSEAKGQEWKLENAAAIETWNRWIDENGLPLGRYRNF